MNPVLSVKDLGIEYLAKEGAKPIVSDISFDVEAGDMVSLVGESGSGKSALVHVIAALPRSVQSRVKGSVDLLGYDMINTPAKQLREMRGTRLGFVGQNPFGLLHPILPLERQFHHVLSAHKKTKSKADSAKLAEATLESVGIRDPRSVLKGYANQLSGGMAQRVVIGMATIMEPEILIADEPTTALDPTVQVQILDLIASLNRERGMTVLIVTHDLGVVANYCDKALVLMRGELVEEGSVSALFTDPKHPYTRELFLSTTERVES